MSATATTLSVQPLEGAQFGAEIRGLDPSNITEADKAVIWDTYRDRHGLICFAFDHLIEADELHSLTSVFGENEYAPGIINGLGKATPIGEEHITVEEQVTKLRAGGRDPFMTYIGNLDPKTLEKKKPHPANSSANGNGTPTCPISKCRQRSAFCTHALSPKMAATPGFAARSWPPRHCRLKCAPACWP